MPTMRASPFVLPIALIGLLGACGGHPLRSCRRSLVLVLEIGAARLLLAGDAEVASWTKILEDDEARAIAESATFLKVGHHGSHNATPLPFVRGLAERTPTMMSTQEGDGSYRKGIPLPELLEALEERHMPLARSDTPTAAGGLFVAYRAGRWTDCLLPC